MKNLLGYPQDDNAVLVYGKDIVWVGIAYHNGKELQHPRMGLVAYTKSQ